MNNQYVLKYPNGSFVALDSASGGYPYATDEISQIKFWPSAEEADTYRQVSQNREGFTIHKVTMLVSEPVAETTKTVPVFVDPPH